MFGAEIKSILYNYWDDYEHKQIRARKKNNSRKCEETKFNRVQFRILVKELKNYRQTQLRDLSYNGGSNHPTQYQTPHLHPPKDFCFAKFLLLNFCCSSFDAQFFAPCFVSYQCCCVISDSNWLPINLLFYWDWACFCGTLFCIGCVKNHAL